MSFSYLRQGQATVPPRVEQLFEAGYAVPEEATLPIKLCLDAYQNKNDTRRANALAFESARYGWVPAMYFLGLQNKTYGHTFAAAKWFSLANQISWLNTGKNHDPSMGELEELNVHYTRNNMVRKNHIAFHVVGYSHSMHKILVPLWLQTQKAEGRINNILAIITHMNKLEKLNHLEHAIFLLHACKSGDAQYIGVANFIQRRSPGLGTLSLPPFTIFHLRFP